MHLTVSARNLDITPALRAYAEEKLLRLTKYLDNIVTGHLVLSLEKHRQIAEATLRVRDLTLRAEESTDDLYSSIDLVVEKLERQILRYKERIGARGLRPARGQGVAEAPGEEPARVVRRKRFAMKPATVEEAMLQMDLLGHGFYVFRNSATEEVNVLYRRKDGDYGLIEPTG